MQRVSRAGVELVQHFEGFFARAYRDVVGVWTIGYGETQGVGPSSGPWSRAYAARRLRQRLDGPRYGGAVRPLRLPGQGQFDAIVSFVYNVGPGGVSSSTGIGRALRARRWRRAADELLRWDKAGGRTWPGLTRRRRRERAMFLAGGAKPDPLRRYPADERTAIRSYDQWTRKRVNRAGRAKARAFMVARRRTIWRLAQPRAKGGDGRGWDHGPSGATRADRYRSLRSRT